MSWWSAPDVGIAQRQEKRSGANGPMLSKTASIRVGPLDAAIGAVILEGDFRTGGSLPLAGVPSDLDGPGNFDIVTAAKGAARIDRCGLNPVASATDRAARHGWRLALRGAAGEIVDTFIVIGLGMLVTGDQHHRGQARVVHPPAGEARSGGWAPSAVGAA